MSYPQGPQYGGHPQQPGGQPQQPLSGAFPQQGYPQQGYPQQGYPQPPVGHPQQHLPYPPPRRNNNGLVIALAAVATAAIIALVVVLIVSGDDGDSADGGPGTGLNPPPGAPSVTIPPPGGRASAGARPNSEGSGGSGSARALAEKAVSIIESRSLSQIDPLACTSTAAGELKRELTRLPPGATAQLGEVKELEHAATARITLDISGQTQTITMEMRKTGSKWCAAGI